MAITAEIPIVEFYRLRLGAMWQHARSEPLSFWAICSYLFIEYVRPQAIIPALDILPWAQVFLLLSLVGRLVEKKAGTLTSDAANVWMTLFLLVIILSSALAEYPATSWKHWFDFVGWYLIYFLIVNIITSERRYFIFLAIFVLASFKLSLFGARTWTMRGFGFTSWGIQGPPGFFTNSGELSIQMLMFAPLGYELALFLRPHVSRLKYYVLLLMPITAAMTVMGASSRGSQVAMVYQAYRSLLKGRLSFKILILVGVLAAAVWFIFPEEQKARFSTAGDDRTSEQRLLYWEHGIDMIERHPVLGVGYFNFPEYYAEHWPEDMLYGAAQLPHNIFIQVGTDAGLLGLFVFVMILYRNFKCVREIQAMVAKAPPGDYFFGPVAKGLAIALWGFIIAGQFVTVTYYPFLWINLALTVSLHNIVRRRFGVTPGVARRRDARTLPS